MSNRPGSTTSSTRGPRRGPTVARAGVSRLLVGVTLLVLGAAACSSGGSAPQARSSASPPAGPTAATAAATNVYAATNVGMFQPATQGVPYRLYVPKHSAGTVSVIDPVAKKVIDTYPTGPGAQHVIPSWDLKTLYAANNENGNSLTPIDPITGKRRGPNLPVADPYNMYFTPDGKYAIVIAEVEKRL